MEAPPVQLMIVGLKMGCLEILSCLRSPLGQAVGAVPEVIAGVEQEEV